VNMHVPSNRFLFVVVAALGSVLLPHPEEACAADPPGPPGNIFAAPSSAVCVLSRSPALVRGLVGSSYYGTKTECDLDRDGNGLDDQIENEIASCFVPSFRFDAKENALKFGEPHALFSVHRHGPATGCRSSKSIG
jgi:hypothetical protein